MGKVRTLILRAPGTNCDVETAFAFEEAGAVVSLVHINELVRGGEKLVDYQIMVIPGGFTHGDDIAAGKVLANELRLMLEEDIKGFIQDGRLILGICNGFQVLVKAGILPEPQDNRPSLTLTTNDSGRFECRWVYLNVNRESPCVFTKGINQMQLPVAHGEGKLVAPLETLPNLTIALYYTDEKGNNEAGYPYNPNGSAENIAGICDSSGRIFALMPHPERYIHTTQHPLWTNQKDRKPGDGFSIFLNAVKWIQNL